MAEEDQSPPASPKHTIADDTVTLQLQQFLDEWYYRIMQSSLGKKWDRKKVAMSALTLLSKNGFNLNESDVKNLAEKDEALMIKNLVFLMPSSMRENFEHVALQLKMLMTTTTRIRKSLEEGTDEQVQEAMEESANTGMGQQVLKQAVVEASKELANIRRCQQTWVANTEKRLDRLQRSAELAEHAQQQLIALEAQLERIGASQNDKSKKVLMGLAEGNDKSLMHSVFSGWLGVFLKVKAEAVIRNKFEKQLEDAERKLFEYKERQLGNVRGTLMRQARESTEGLLSMCMAVWTKYVADIKLWGDTDAALKSVEGKLTEFSSEQAANTKRVMARMGADQDATLVSLTFGNWVKFSEDYKKDKEFEDAVKAAEKQVQEHMAKKKEDTKTVLNRINGATDSGLLSMMVTYWQQYCKEEKKMREKEEMLGGATGKFKSLQERQIGNARGVQTKVNEQIAANLTLRVFQSWLLESKINRMEKYYTTRLDGKRKQLHSVQTLFKSFAEQLEKGLRDVDGDSSGRKHSRRQSHGLTKGEGSVSLPDIHARQGLPAV